MDNTNVSGNGPEGFEIRGVPIEQQLNNPWSESVFLAITGRQPTGPESRVFNALLTLSMDHGAATVSAHVTRSAASTKSPLNASVAAGLLALGPRHGLAITSCMQTLSEISDPEAYVSAAIEAKQRIPGFGHRIYRGEDPRARMLERIARDAGMPTPMFDRARSIEKALQTAKGDRLVLNIDGAIGAILLDMKIPANAGDAVFLVSRTVGLAAHALEASEHQMKRPAEETVQYDPDVNR